MRSRIGFISQRVGLNLAQSGTDVLLKWKEWSAAPAVDPTTESRLGTATDQSETVKAFVHYAQATSAVRQFAEVEVGDCIVDFHQDVVLEGRDSLVFVINGEEWKLKQVGDKLARSWNATMAGQNIFRTVLLRKTT